VPLDVVGATLTRTDPFWIAAAVFVYATNLSLRAWRWQIILRPISRIRYRDMATALLLGYGFNNILPARLGEVFRAEFAKRDFGLPRTWAFSSILIERLCDAAVVLTGLGIGLVLAAATRQSAGALMDVLVGGAAAVGVVSVAAYWLAGPKLSQIFASRPRISLKLALIQEGLAILRTWRTAEIVAITLLIYLPDAFTLWCIVKAVGVGLGFADTLILVGAASLSTLIPSGPAFLGTLQFGYVLAIDYAGGPTAVGIAAATLSQLCILLPVALIATGILIHKMGRLFFTILTKREYTESGSMLLIHKSTAT
jgi:uncharacterized protein (TIRG00374 family)